MDVKMIDILVQGGAVGIVIGLLVYMNKRDNRRFKKDEMFNNTLNNHFEHDTKAKEKLAKAITKLSDNVRNCPYNKK